MLDEQVPKRQSPKKKKKPKKSNHKHDWLPYRPMEDNKTGVRMLGASTGKASYLFMYIKKCRICGKEKISDEFLLNEDRYKQVHEDFKRWEE